jgi:hypothetical protein
LHSGQRAKPVHAKKSVQSDVHLFFESFEHVGKKIGRLFLVFGGY